jgi:Tol biopolymer transport system component
LIRHWIQSGVNSIETNQQTGLIERQIQSGIESNVAISPNGKQFVFFEGQLAYRMNTDGTQLTRLPALADSNLTRRTTFVPMWSSDGQQIAFAAAPELQSSSPKGNAQVVNLYVMNRDGSKLIRLNDDGDLRVSHLMWQP